MRRLPVALAAAGWVAVLGAGPVAHPVMAGATAGAGHHRAAVIVDTGTQVKTVCVRFAEESITGVEALQRAGVDPVFRAFPGKGAAVCSLCGTGCSGDESCLTCDPDGRYWSYSRAVAGSSGLRVSGAGASSTTVRDGDVEGWRWGLGGTPELVTVEQVCGEAPATSTSTSSSTSTSATAQPSPARAPVTSPPGSATGTTGPGSRRSATGSSTTTTAAPTAGAAGATVPAGPAPTSVATPVGATAAAVGGPAPTSAPTSAAPGGLAAADNREAEGGGGWGGLVVVGAALAALLAWATVARRRRRGGP